MTTYEFEVPSGDWSDASLWLNQSSGMYNDGAPGAGDTAYIYADYNSVTLLTTAGQSVANVSGTGQGEPSLNGVGLNVSGNMFGLTLIGGAYSVGGSAVVTLLKGTLSGHAIGGSTGALIKGGEVTSSDTFLGDVSGDGIVNTTELLSGQTTGSGKIKATSTSASALITELGGLFKFGSVSLGSGGSGTVQAGIFNDSGAFLLMQGATMTFSGGTATIAGAADVENSGSLSVTGASQMTLNAGLMLGQNTGGAAKLSVGSVGKPGGTLTVQTGAVMLGGQGPATVSISTGGIFNALSSNVVIAKQSSSTSTVTVANGGKFHAGYVNVGKGGQGALNITSGGRVNVGQTLTVGANTASSVSVMGSGSTLTVAGAVTVGGQSYGMASITIGAGATAALGATTISKLSGEIIDSGTLNFNGAVKGLAYGMGLVGPEQLEIKSGAVVNAASSVAGMRIDFSGAGKLNLSDPTGFTANISAISSGGSITAAGFEGATEFFNQSSGTAYLVGATVLPIHFLGSHTSADFSWNSATATLSFT